MLRSALAGRLGRLPQDARADLSRRGAALRADLELARIARGDGPVIAGPWRSEIGFEVLYWIPMLRWLVTSAGIDPQRIIAVSRGGADRWYDDVAGRYVDLFDHFSADDMRGWHEQQVAETGSQKQTRISATEERIVTTVREATGARGADVLHPSVMYRLFQPFWSGRQPLRAIKERTRYERLPDPGDPAAIDPRLADLPDDYFAVKLYFRGSFPETEENVEFAQRLLSRLASERPVVMLATNLALDDHRDFLTQSGSEIYAIDHLVTPRNNLHVQSAVIARARALIGTYGGFSYLGPLLGVPSCSFYSKERFVAGHLEVMRRATRFLRDRDGHQVGFVTMHTQDFGVLDSLLGGSPRVAR